MPEFWTDSVEGLGIAQRIAAIHPSHWGSALLLLCSIVFSKDGHSTKCKDLDTRLDLELER